MAADYESIGVCPEFIDGWFNPLLEIDGEEPIVDTNIELLRNKTNPNLIALKDPYSNPAWVNEFGFTKRNLGYLLLDITDPDWVQVVPLVDINVENKLQDGTVENYYPYNVEGLYVWQGIDYSGILTEWQLFGEESSNLTGNEINLYHLYFGIDHAPTGGYWWKSVPDDFQRHASITLPDGWTSGINSVMGEVNAPVKYYNLQGMEVSAPVKGQLTIKKQGNKSVKFIAK